MRLKFILAPILAITLAGCSPQAAGQAVTGTISSVAPEAMLDAKKALTAAHDLHRASANFLTVAAQTNLCHATCAVTAKRYLVDSEAYLVAADRLVALGDAPGIEAKIKAASALTGQINALIGQ